MPTIGHEPAAAPAPFGSAPGSGLPDAPPPATRGEFLLTRVDRGLAWLDGLIARWIPHESNPLAQAGAAANFALMVAVVSGIALLGWYSPSLQFAHASVAEMADSRLGGWVRAMHRYSSDFAILLVLVHATRVFFARKFSGARWLPWVSGVGLAGLVWFIGWTGYWLVWDQPAQSVAVSSMRLLDALPIFGEPLGRLYVVDRLVPSLLFFVVFFLHMLLPLGIAIGLAVHLTRVSRARLLPNRRLALAMFAGLALAAWFVPAPLEVKAAMAEKAASFTVDAWYLTPLALALRFQHSGLWLALFGTGVCAAAIPWLLGRRRAPIAYQAVVEPSRCHACTQCVQDCPFDAITMVARTDGKRFPSQALVDPSKCVGCGVCAGSCDSEGISLPWFDTRREETRIAAEIAAVCNAGGPPWVAFVAGDIDSGLGMYVATRWRERLPGYQVHFVPTSSWVRPKFVESLLAGSVRGVMVVRDARAEAPARDGNRWVADRFTGERKPVFRPDRAGGSSAWCVIDYNSTQPAELAKAAERFQKRGTSDSREPRPARWWARILAGCVLALALAAATLGPSHLPVTNPASPAPELVFSFKAFGDRSEAGVVDAAADANKPIHMRGRSTAKPNRADITVRVTVDGNTQERVYRAKGISRDGPAIDEWRHPLTPGPHEVAIELITGLESNALHWNGEIVAEPRRLHVITFEPEAGFRVE